ncbi:MAG: carbonic anhydrase [Methylococcaceae bacterium]|jgi:carbonic anhydrase
MLPFERLILENRAWADEKIARDPDFFKKQATHQSPEFLWIGCSDSRVPAEIIVNATPGEIFVHRNIANQIITTDFNSLSVVQFAVQVLKVKQIIVCGHYNCGGIKAALDKQRPDLTLVNSWLMHIKDIYRLHQKDIEMQPSYEARIDRLVEFNIIEQIHKLAHTPIIQQAWKNQQSPTLHGCVYGLDNGLITELITLTPDHAIEPIYQYTDLIS